MEKMKRTLLVALLVLSSAMLSAKTLVLYYSYTNHVKELVDELSSMVSVDVVRIEPTDKSGGYELNNYAKGTQLLNAINAAPDDINSYPGIEPTNINWADYDRVVIGTPLWWSQMAAVTQTFLFLNRDVLPTKQLYLMVSSYSSISGVEADARRLVPGGNFASPSLWVNNASHSNRHNLVSQWVSEVHLDQATAISLPTTTKSSAATEVFDLAGRRVAKAAKGIYFVNGKKVAIGK